MGSDDHATSAASLLSLIASARLHRLNPEEYLRDIFRVLPHWPKDRHLELAPKYWSVTRDRLDARALAPAPAQQASSD
jgi:transposase